jgi:DNA-binding protein H-NS
VANVVLAGFAIVTAVLAGLAFRKQSREVSDQAEMLDLQRRQLAEQEKTSAKQAEILELQATELRESLEERKLSAARRRREQAAHVFLTEKPHPGTTWRSTAATTPSRLR